MTTRVVRKNNTTRTFTVGYSNEPCTLIVNTNGGSIAASIQIDTELNEWVSFNVFDTDGAYKIESNGCSVRFTPSGGAEYAFVRP